MTTVAPDPSFPGAANSTTGTTIAEPASAARAATQDGTMDSASRGAGELGQRRNTWLLGIDMAVFAMGLGALGQLTIIPLFVSKLTDNPLAVGAVAAAIQIGWLPQLFLAGTIERRAQKWPWVTRFSTFERVPSLLLAVCALAAPFTGPWIVVVIYLCCFAQTLFGGLCVAPWMDVIARVVPGRLRGRFMGLSNTAGTLLGAGSAALVAPLLDWYPFPYNFAASFGIAGTIYAIGLIPLYMVREPPGPPPRPPRPFRAQLGELPGILRTDARFRQFSIGLCVAALATMSSGFLVVYGVNVLGAPDDMAGWYTACLFVAQMAASTLLGWLGDRFGSTAVARVMAFGIVGACAVALLAPAAIWLLAAFALLGVVQSANLLTRVNGPIEYAPVDRRPSYVALAFGLVGPFAALAPLVGGQIVALLGYGWLFGTSMALALVAALAFGEGARAPRRAT